MPVLVLILTLLCSGWSTPVRAQEEPGTVSFELFYDSLDPYGEWISVDGYGYCWRPNAAMDDSEWRPYTVGNWAWTGGGWTWISEEDFGWAVYHYGRWVQLQDLGWVWVPGYEWAPAWVAWRSSADEEYVGWAPLPPEAEFDREIGFNSWVDRYYDIGPSSYTFVTVTNFGEPRLCDVMVPWHRNVVIMTNSVNITNIVYRSNVVNFLFIGGPVYVDINRRCRHEIRSLRLERAEHFDYEAHRHHPKDMSKSMFQRKGDALVVAAPIFRRPSDTNRPAPAKVSTHIDKPKVNHGWSNLNNQTLVDTLRDKIHGPKAPELPKVLPPKHLPGLVQKGGGKQPEIRRADAVDTPVTIKRPTVVAPPVPTVIPESIADRRARILKEQARQETIIKNGGNLPMKPGGAVRPGKPETATQASQQEMRERAQRAAQQNQQINPKKQPMQPEDRVIQKPGRGPSPGNGVATQDASKARQQAMEQQRQKAAEALARSRQQAIEQQRQMQPQQRPDRPNAGGGNNNGADIAAQAAARARQQAIERQRQQAAQDQQRQIQMQAERARAAAMEAQRRANTPRPQQPQQQFRPAPNSNGNGNAPQGNPQQRRGRDNDDDDKKKRR